MHCLLLHRGRHIKADCVRDRSSVTTVVLIIANPRAIILEDWLLEVDPKIILEARSRKPLVAAKDESDVAAVMTGRAGRRYVRVVYDYEYTANDGRAITIKQGDECLLLKKTNSEWWSVIKSGEKKPIYVPANYVEEIQAKHGGKNRGNLHQQSKQGSVEDVADDEKSRSSSEDLLQSDDNGVENGGGSCDTSEHDSDSVHNKLTASEDSLDRLVDVDPDLERLENAQRGQGVDEYEPVQYANLEAIQEAIRQKVSI